MIKTVWELSAWVITVWELRDAARTDLELSAVAPNHITLQVKLLQFIDVARTILGLSLMA